MALQLSVVFQLQTLKLSKIVWPWFGCALGWNGSSSSGLWFRRLLCKQGFSVFQSRLTGKDGSCFGSWKTLFWRFRFRFREQRFRRFRFPVPVRFLSPGLHTQIFVFGITVPQHYISVAQKLFLKLISRKLHYTYFICDSENCMLKLSWIFLRNCMSVTQRNVFGINFAIISEWCVDLDASLGHTIVRVFVYISCRNLL